MKTKIGDVYGKLTVIAPSNQRVRGRVCWVCQCECGNIITVIGTDLRTNRKTHCGCSFPNIKNEIGNRYGHLTVISKDKMSSNDRHAKWICQCDCGNIVSVSGHNLRNYSVQGCGCSRRSQGEEEIQNLLEKNNIKFLKEYYEVNAPELLGENNRYLRFDFAILNEQNDVVRLIEFDGKQHYFPVKKWGGEKALKKLQSYDKRKNLYAFKNKIPLVRLPYSLKTKITLEDILGEKYEVKIE